MFRRDDKHRCSLLSIHDCNSLSFCCQLLLTSQKKILHVTSIVLRPTRKQFAHLWTENEVNHKRQCSNLLIRRYYGRVPTLAFLPLTLPVDQTNSCLGTFFGATMRFLAMTCVRMINYLLLVLMIFLA